MRKEEKDREKEKKPVNLIRKIALLLLLTAPVLSVFWVGGGVWWEYAKTVHDRVDLLRKHSLFVRGTSSQCHSTSSPSSATRMWRGIWILWTVVIALWCPALRSSHVAMSLFCPKPYAQCARRPTSSCCLAWPTTWRLQRTPDQLCPSELIQCSRRSARSSSMPHLHLRSDVSLCLLQCIVTLLSGTAMACQRFSASSSEKQKKWF